MTMDTGRMLALTGMLTMGLHLSAEEAKPAAKSMFGRFIGVCQASADPKRPELWKNISFVRNDLSWGRVQPKGRESWDQEYLDKWGKTILRNREMGVETLPMLGYMAPWAARKRAWSFTIGTTRYEVSPAQGTEKRKAIATNLKTGEKKEVTFSPGILPPEDVKDWENFIERVVTFLSQPPYNVTFLQPWNEAYDQFTGFWVGGLDEYMETIHLPAARIIRKHGGKVVYGGWPCCGNAADYLALLDKHKAWDTLDVLDVHYLPLSTWQLLYDRTRMKNRIFGLWQTEVGFTKSTGWVPNTYPRFFHWALRHGWQPDRYRIFQFAYWSPDDPKAYGYHACLMASNKLNYHGKALVTLGKLLDSQTIQPYTAWKTRPVLRSEISRNQSSVEGFDTGSRLVLAVHLVKENDAAIFTDWNLTMDTLHLDWPTTTLDVRLPEVKPQDVTAAQRVGIYGSRLPLRIKPEGKGIRLTVPVCDGNPEEEHDNRAALASTFYVVVEHHSD